MSSDTNTPDVLAGNITREQLATQLRKTSRTLHRWETEGFGPPVIRIGKSVLYSVESVRRWIASQERRSR